MKILSVENGYNRNIINYEEEGVIKQFIFPHEMSLDSAMKELEKLCAESSENTCVKASVKKEHVKKSGIKKTEKNE